MSQNPLRRAMRLFETISDDPALNAEIESRLLAFDADKRTLMLDALEMLKHAGGAGLTRDAWHSALQGVDPTTAESDIDYAIAESPRHFDCCVKPMLGGVYKWFDSRTRDIDDDGIMDPMMKNAVESQVTLSHHMMSIAQRLGTFTRDQLRSEASRVVSPMMVEAYIDHFIDQFAGTVFRPNPNGSYTVANQTAAQTSDFGAERHLGMWRDMAQRAGDIPRMEESAKPAKKNVGKAPAKAQKPLHKQKPTVFPNCPTKDGDFSMQVSHQANESRAPSMRDMMNQLNETEGGWKCSTRCSEKKYTGDDRKAFSAGYSDGFHDSQHVKKKYSGVGSEAAYLCGLDCGKEDKKLTESAHGKAIW